MELATPNKLVYPKAKRGDSTMANREKFTRAAIGHMCAHFARGKDQNGNFYKFGNQDIDSSRTYLNFNLAEVDQPIDQKEFITERMKDLKCLNRKNVNVMMTWLVTLPKEMNNQSDLEKRKFFEKTYEFLKHRYGKENVISAFVHMDESQPHMHFAYTPVMWDEKKNSYRFNAKVVGSRTDLQTFHEEFDQYMTKEMGYITGVRNGKTEINLSIKELKELQKRMNTIDRQLTEIRSEMPIKGVLGYKTKEVDMIVKENELLEKKHLLASERVNAISRAKHGVENELKKVMNSTSAKKREELVEQINELENNLYSEREKNIELQHTVSILHEKTNELKQLTEELQQENSKLNNQLQFYRQFFNQVLFFLKEMMLQGKEKFINYFKSFLYSDQIEKIDQILEEKHVYFENYEYSWSKVQELNGYKLFQLDTDENIYLFTDENNQAIQVVESSFEPDLTSIIDDYSNELEYEKEHDDWEYER